MAAYTGASQWITGEAARAPRPHPAQPVPVHPGGGGHGAGRRPPAHLPHRGGAQPPADRLRHPPAHPPHRPGGGERQGPPPPCMATCVTERTGSSPPMRRRAAGCSPCPSGRGHVSLPALLERLGRDGGGQRPAGRAAAALHWSAVEAGVVHKVQAYLAPKILGGQEAKSPVGGQGFPDPDQALHLKDPAPSPAWGRTFCWKARWLTDVYRHRGRGGHRGGHPQGAAQRRAGDRRPRWSWRTCTWGTASPSTACA